MPKVFKEGYLYGLINVENPQLKGQTIQFIETEMIEGGKIPRTLTNGTSLEELLEVAFAKAKFDNRPMIVKEHGSTINPNATKERANAITAIETAILWLKRVEELKNLKFS